MAISSESIRLIQRKRKIVASGSRRGVSSWYLCRIEEIEADAARLRAALREIVRMTAKGADAPMTAERWLDRIDEVAIAALSQKEPKA